MSTASGASVVADQSSAVASRPADISDVAEAICQRVGERKFTIWFRRATRFSIDPSGPTLTLTVPNPFVSEWIHREFMTEVSESARLCLGESADVAVRIDPAAFLRDSSAARASASQPIANPADPARAHRGEARDTAGNGAVQGVRTARSFGFLDEDDPTDTSRDAGPGHGMTSASGRAGNGRRGDRPDNHSGPGPGVLSHGPTGGGLAGHTAGSAWGQRSTATRDAMGPAFSSLIRTVPLRHRLDDFVVGQANQLAYTAADRLVSEGEHADAAWNRCVFLHGGCGLGKTHLLQGACKAFRQRHAGALVLYTTGEQFTNAFIQAVRDKTLDRFRRELRRVDLLALDDVHFMADKEKTQAEFLYSFDCIERTGARVILASDSHPKEISRFSQALISRCVQGLVAEILPPDPDTMRKLIMSMAARRGLLIQAAAAAALVDFLEQRGASSVRDIEGLTVKLHAYAQGLDGGSSRARSHAGPGGGGGTGGNGEAVGEPGWNRTSGRLVVGQAMVDRLIRSEAADRPRRMVTMDDIVDAVCGVFRLAPTQLLSKSRHRQLVIGRSICIELARELTSLSYPEIARAMRRPNHSTIITAHQRLRQQLDEQEPMLLQGLPEPVTVSLLLQRCRKALNGPSDRHSARSR